jgi:hypothetical protein
MKPQEARALIRLAAQHGQRRGLVWPMPGAARLLFIYRGCCFFNIIFSYLYLHYNIYPAFIYSYIGNFPLMIRYKLTFMARDETGEAVMFCFDSVAKRIVGKPCETVLRSMSPSDHAPTNILGITSLKFTFHVSLTEESYYNRNKVLHINSIITSHGKQHYELSTPIKIPTTSIPEESPSAAMNEPCTITPSKVTNIFL